MGRAGARGDADHNSCLVTFSRRSLSTALRRDLARDILFDDTMLIDSSFHPMPQQMTGELHGSFPGADCSILEKNAALNVSTGAKNDPSDD
jgi:hypothetical protein